MEVSRKSFKALSMAQPIKKDIDDTLTKLEAEKRKFLSFERQESVLKEELHNIRQGLNEAKLIEPKTRVNENKNTQQNLSINNTDRLYLSTINKISQCKTTIDVHRRQVAKYKKLSESLSNDIRKVAIRNDQQETQLQKKQQENEIIKDSLLEYRELNMRNTTEFMSSFNALNHSKALEEKERSKTQAMRRSFQAADSRTLLSAAKITGSTNQLGSGEEGETFHEEIKSVPLAKERVRQLILSNKEKIKISDNYRKFGEGLENMFAIMKAYKGKDDITDIGDEFVTKEKMINKIEQYIAKLENRLMDYEHEIAKMKRLDKKLESELFKSDEGSEATEESFKDSEAHYVKLQSQIQQSLDQLKQSEEENTQWFRMVGEILSPLVNNEEEFNRSSAEKVLGDIEADFMSKRRELNEQQPMGYEQIDKGMMMSSTKAPVAVIDEKQVRVGNTLELMSYEKMMQYANEYIASKK